MKKKDLEKKKPKHKPLRKEDFPDTLNFTLNPRLCVTAASYSMLEPKVTYQVLDQTEDYYIIKIKDDGSITAVRKVECTVAVIAHSQIR